MIFRFDQITLDTERYRLLRSGNPVAVEPQVFDLLAYLVEHRDRVVSRDELLDNIWKGKVVTDSALGARLRDARKAIGDNGTRQAIIRTYNRRGYQFVADVNENPENEDSDSGYLPTAQDILSLPDKPSIAVLPFANLSGDSTQEHFADGLTDEIITALSRIPGLFVIANNSVMTYKGRAVDVRQVGREQGVRYVLEGGFRREADEIRVTAQLIDTQTGLHLWAERYQRKLDGIFAVQEDITHRVAVELQVKLVTGERSRNWAIGTETVEAWECLIRAKSLVEKHAHDGALHGRDLARKALELDPQYSAAWTILGWACWEESVWGWGDDPEQSMRDAEQAAAEALQKDLVYPGAYALLGYIHLAKNENRLAIEAIEKAVALAPSDGSVLALLGNALIETGDFARGIAKLKKAIRLCPFPPVWYLSVLGAGYYLDGDADSAIAALEAAIEREPDSNLARLWLIGALVESGQIEKARRLARDAMEISPEFDARSWVESFVSDASAQQRVLDSLREAGFRIG